MEVHVKTLATTLLTLCLSTIANAAAEFPFSLTRDQAGQIARIEIQEQASLAGEENILTQLRSQLSIGATLQLNESALSNDERKVFARAKAALIQSVSLSELNNPALEQEFARALPKLKDIKVYRLIASPYQQNAFDQENTIKEVVNQVLSLGKKALQGPAFEVFEFLVNETLEGLESRREFHQNRLLYWLDQNSSEFTEEERNYIRTSIFYSRLGMLDFLSRKRAQSSWSTYGTAQYRSQLAKCKGFVAQGEEHFGMCFKVTDKKIQNILVKRSSFSKGTSVAYQFEKPYQVRNERAVILLLKLALRFVPGPGFAKNGVRSWLESQYLVQRRTEGFLYEAVRLQGNDELAPMILVSTANPLITPRYLR